MCFGKSSYLFGFLVLNEKSCMSKVYGGMIRVMLQIKSHILSICRVFPVKSEITYKSRLPVNIYDLKTSAFI